MRAPQAFGVGVIAVAKDGQAWVGRHNGGGVHTRDVGDDQVRRDARLGGQRVLAKKPLEPSAEEEVDTLELDRRHVLTVAGC